MAGAIYACVKPKMRGQPLPRSFKSSWRATPELAWGTRKINRLFTANRKSRQVASGDPARLNLLLTRAGSARVDPALCTSTSLR